MNATKTKCKSEMDLSKCTVTSGRPFDQKEKIRCVFCRGSSCKRCGETAYMSLENPAIEKLHSSWVDDSILAMQRPNDTLMKESNLIEQFQANNIVAIFNLTEPGEHPFCGYGNLKSSGFPYYPETLMAAGIKHFNYSWPDMTAPSINLMKDIVNVACSEINQGGKIAVHCHAGFGRTGIAIAAILIALKGTGSKEVIAQIRQKRPGSIQTQKQKEFVYHFERCHWDTLQVFPMPRTHAKYSTAAVLAYSGPFSRTESRTEMKSFDSLATLGTSSLRRSESDNLSRSNHSPNLSQATNSVSSSAKRASITLNLIETPNESEKNALIKKNKTMSSDRSFDHVHKVGSHENILSISDKATKSPSLTDSPPLHKIEIIQENVPLSSHIILGSPKSISQSISDQQYSLPLIGRETDNSSGCHVNNNDTAANNSSNIPNGIYNNDRKAGSNENMWCHQLVILCTSALKQSLTPGNIVTERNCGRFDDTYSKINLLRCRKSLVDISTAMSGGVSVSVQVNMIGEVLPDNTNSYIDDDGNLRLNPTNDEENDDNLLSSATDGYNIDKKDNSKPKESRNHNVVDKSFNVFNAYITTLKTEINGGKWDTIRYISEKLHEYFECDEAALTARRSSSSGSSTAGRRTSIKNLLDIQEMKMMIELNEMKNRDLLESSLNNIDSDAHDDLDSDIIAALKNIDGNSGTSIDDDKIMDDIINYDGDSKADNHFDQSAVCGNDDDYEESDYGVSTPILSQNCSLEFLAANADTNGNEDDDDSIDEEEEAKDGITIITRLLLEYIDTRADTIFDDVMIKEISTIWKDFHRNNSNLADDDPIGDLNAGMTDKSKIKSRDKVGGNNLNVKVIDGGNSLQAVFSDLNKLFSNSGIKRAKLSLLQQLVDLMKSFYAVLPGEQSPSLTSSTAQSPSRSLGYRHLNGIDIDNDNGEKNQNGASRTKIEVTDTNNDEKNQLLTVNGSNSHCTTISQSVPTRLQQDNEIPEVVGVRKFDQDQDHVLGPSVTYTESVTEVKAYKLTLLRLAVSCSINLRQHESCLIENIDLNSRCAKNIPVALAENILRKFQLSNYAISNDDFPKAAPAEATSLRDQDENQINCNENGTREESLDGNIPSPEIIETIKVEGQIMHKLILCSKAESILTQGETLESDYAATSRNLKGEGNNESSDGKDDDGYTADILSIMETLHLLVIKSWNHMEVLPNRLFRNRKCSTSAPSLQ